MTSSEPVVGMFKDKGKSKLATIRHIYLSNKHLITYNKYTIIRGFRWELALRLSPQGEVQSIGKARTSYTVAGRSQDAENSSAP